MTERTLGKVIPEAGPPLTRVELILSPLDLVVQWRRCGLSADYVAEHLAYSFEARDTARNVLSTVANELLENAAKFSADKHRQVRFSGSVGEEGVRLTCQNVADGRSVAALEGLFAAMEEEGPAAIFDRRVVAPGGGGLGLLILARDYRAALGVTLAPERGSLSLVTLRAVIPTDAVEHT